jgi:hypothetical protein
MADQLSWSAIGEWLAGFAPEGPLRTAVLLVYGLCVAVAPFIYKYYLGVLAQGAAPVGSLERQDYDALRKSLAGDNLAARLYASWLKRFLDAVDRFFGDAGMADRTLFPHAFGLKKPVPLWTPPAFDRCLLLALIYPIVTIFVIWAISGHVGPAESALGLQPDISGWKRGLFVGWNGLATFGFWRLAVTAAGALADGFVAVIGGGGVFFLAVAVAGAAGRGVTAYFTPYLTLHVAGVVAAAGLALLFPLVVGAFGALVYLSRVSIAHRWHGIFLSLFVSTMAVACLGVSTMAVACLGATEWLSPSFTWIVLGPFLLFVGLLTLLNAPFDWASLGLTRALLWRGLELGGWWPYILAFVDAGLAVASSRSSR